MLGFILTQYSIHIKMQINIISAMTLPEWNPCLSESDFSYSGDLIPDLCLFAESYLGFVFFKASFGDNLAPLQTQQYIESTVK